MVDPRVDTVWRGRIPAELSERIFSELDATALTRCLAVSKYFLEIITSSPELQYRLELFRGGMIDNADYTCGFETSKGRLQALIAYRDRWRNLTPRLTLDNLDYLNGWRIRNASHFVHVSHLSGGQLTVKDHHANPNPFHSDSEQFVDDLRISRLPSAITDRVAVPRRCLDNDHLIFYVVTDPLQDLIVVIEINKQVNAVLVHFRTHSSNTPHRQATIPTIRVPIEVEGTIDSLGISMSSLTIFDHVVGVIAQWPMIDDDTTIEEVRCFFWDWKAGVLKCVLVNEHITGNGAGLDNDAHIYPSPFRPTISFIFLNSSLVAVPTWGARCTETVAEAHVTLYCIDRKIEVDHSGQNSECPESESKINEPRKVVNLQFPILDSSRTDSHRRFIRVFGNASTQTDISNPSSTGPSISSPSGWRLPITPHIPFQPDPLLRLIAFNLNIRLQEDGEETYESRKLFFFTTVNSVMKAVSEYSKARLCGLQDETITWAEWSKYGACAIGGIDRPYHHWVHGTRCMVLPFATQDRYERLVILDFAPGNKRAAQDNCQQSGSCNDVQVTAPGQGNREEGDCATVTYFTKHVLVDDLLENGELSTHMPMMKCESRIGEPFEGVMMDSESILFLRQRHHASPQADVEVWTM